MVGDRDDRRPARGEVVERAVDRLRRGAGEVARDDRLHLEPRVDGVGEVDVVGIRDAGVVDGERERLARRRPR